MHSENRFKNLYTIHFSVFVKTLSYLSVLFEKERVTGILKSSKNSDAAGLNLVANTKIMMITTMALSTRDCVQLLKTDTRPWWLDTLGFTHVKEMWKPVRCLLPYQRHRNLLSFYSTIFVSWLPFSRSQDAYWSSNHTSIFQRGRRKGEGAKNALASYISHP